jgi:AAA ATPase domain
VELAGREHEIEAFRVLVARIKAGQSEQSQIVSGLRGMGKTVLLNKFEDFAESAGFITSFRELTPETSLVSGMVKDADRALRTLSLSSKASASIKKALGRMESIKVGGLGGVIDLQVNLKNVTEEALADDLTRLLLELGRTAKAKSTGLAFFIDEVQFVDEVEFRALISALHRAAQKSLPLIVAAAGLPQIPGLAGEARSYAERLFEFPRIEALDQGSAAAALTVPAGREDVKYQAAAVDRAYDLTEGYPFYIQQLGKHVWNVAEQSPITKDQVDAAAPAAEKALDRGLYEVRIQRTTDREKRMLRAMAELGDGPYLIGAVAKRMGMATTSLSPVRASLLGKGLIYATEDRGVIDFSIPRFAQFMKRFMPFAPRKVAANP